MARQSGVGIKDVARVAGVSVGTVSNVLNRLASVSPNRRARVQAAIEELGYVPNDAARRLKAGVSRIVGLVVIDTQNPFYGSIALEAEQAAEEHGLGLFVANSHLRDGKEEYYLSQFEQQRVRGVLVTPSGADLDQHQATADRGTPVVLVDSVDPEEGFCTIVVDDHYGGYLAVDHLIGLGRTRIIVVGGPPHFRQVGRRHAGALAAAEGRGAELAYLEAPDMTILAGRAIGEQILRTMSPLPDAIFAMNDLLATGLLQALVMTRGVRVPEDIALIGYDDIDFCANAIVPISSVRQPSAELGRRAVELLEAEIADGRAHEHVSIVLKPVLVVRQSTAGATPAQS